MACAGPTIVLAARVMALPQRPKRVAKAIQIERQRLRDAAKSMGPVVKEASRRDRPRVLPSSGRGG